MHASSNAVIADPVVPALKSTLCRHCGAPIPSARLRSGESFCCSGCFAVHSFLRDLKLDREYYALRTAKAPRTSAPFDENEDFSAFDVPPYRLTNGRATLDFFIEGIQCAACVWLLERLPGMRDGIRNARLDFGRSLLRVEVDDKGSFGEVVRLLGQLGYRAYPVLTRSDAEEGLARSDRSTLKRIGVAAFSAMNVMIYSVGLYAGVAQGYAVLFRWLSLIVAIPALSYSAWPFYASAWRALRRRRISIDLPISLAFLGGLAESFRQASIGTNLLYLDSITALVLLMLLSRYALSRLERSESSKSGVLRILLPDRARKLDAAGIPSWVAASSLALGERIVVQSGEKVPADGTVVEGIGLLDLAFLTGETHPVRAACGDAVYAGARVLDGRFVLRVTAVGSETRLGEIESRLQWVMPRNNGQAERADRIARGFLAVVLGLAAVLFLAFGPEHSDEAVRRSLSLLIVACPCALALATPLALARAFRLASSRGILMRDLDALERLSRVRRIVFDKTGTLTSGRPELRRWDWEAGVSDGEKPELLSLAYSIESEAAHPFGKAIVRAFENLPEVRLVHGLGAEEIPGRGVRGWWAGRAYALTGFESAGESGVEFRRDGELLARAQFTDALRADAAPAIAALRRRGMKLEIVSGDAERVVRGVAKDLGVADWSSRVSPEGKAEAVSERSGGEAIAVGDGINDGLALRAASVGVAFSRGEGESLERMLAGSAVAILKPRLAAVDELIEIALRYRRTLRRNAILSVFYNFAGASLAVTGLIHPLVAAILMPVSSLTVFLSTAVGIRLPGRKEGA